MTAFDRRNLRPKKWDKRRSLLLFDRNILILVVRGLIVARDRVRASSLNQCAAGNALKILEEYFVAGFLVEIERLENA